MDEVEEEGFLAVGDLLDRHGEALIAVEGGDDFSDGPSAPGVEEVFGEGAAMLGEDGGPGEVVEGHGVGYGAVAVEEVSLEGAWGEC